MPLNGRPALSTPRGRQFLLKIHNLLYLGEEPAVDFGELKNFLHAEARAQGVPDEEDSLRIGHAEFLADDFPRQNVTVLVNGGPDAPGLAVPAQAGAADFQ